MVDIIDIKKPEFSNFDLKAIIRDGLDRPCGQKEINTLVLYDDRGLQLFDQVTYVPEYYLTEAEIDILKKKSAEIVDCIPDGAVIIELGSGSLRKTKLLLDAVDAKRSNVHYYALDVMEKELIKSLESLGSYKNISTHGFWGTYDDGMDQLLTFPKSTPKVILWMGSSIGNLSRQEAQEFLIKLQSKLNINDHLLVGIDLRNSSERLSLAYNDPAKVSRDFIMNGLSHCNHIFNQTIFDLNKFSFLSKVDPDSSYHESLYLCHEAHSVEFKDPDINDITTFKFYKDEEIHVEYSFKYSAEEIKSLTNSTKFIGSKQWMDSSNSYTLNLLKKLESQEACLEDYKLTVDVPVEIEGEAQTSDWNLNNHINACPIKPISLSLSS